jgi:hypothetical protein
LATRSLGVAGLVLLLNLPFGYWRSGCKRFSLPWFLAVHASVPLIVGLRLLSGIGWRLATLPLFVGAYAAGQFLGGKARQWRRRGARRELSD